MLQDGKEKAVIGIEPDAHVSPTLQDILEAHDSVLEKGVEILQSCL